MKPLANVFCVAALLATPGLAGDAKKASAGTFKCKFDDSVTATFLATGEVRPVLSKERMELTLACDLAEGKGFAVGNGGGAELFVTRTRNSLTFVEQTAAGNQIYTTIFDAKKGAKRPAVMSRHTNLDPTPTQKSPLPSQWYGYCVSG